MRKFLKVSHYCEECFSKVRYNSSNATPLLQHQLVADVNEDFSISEITELVKKNTNKQTCKKHPNAKTFVRFSFYHEETIEL